MPSELSVVTLQLVTLDAIEVHEVELGPHGGGGGGVDSPDDIPGLVRWYDVNQEPVVADLTRVGLLTERMGSGEDADQTPAGTTQDPYYRNAANGIGGKPCFEFRAADFTRIWAPVWTPTIAQPLTVGIVCKMDATPGTTNFVYFFDDVDGTSRVTFLAQGPTGGNGVGMGASGTNYFAAGSLNTNAHYYLLIFNGAGSKLRRDGAQIATGTVGAAAMKSLQLGTRNDDTAPISGKIAEICVYDHELSAQEITDWETLMAAKYGL